MLFWLFVIILVVGIGFIVIGNYNWDREKHYFLYKHDSDITTIGGWIVAISGIILAIMIIILCYSHICINTGIEKNKVIYKAIEYKVTSGICRDEFGLLSKEVIDEVQEWNKDVKHYQTVQDDFWIGIFYPNVFDQFETIDYERYNNIK